MGARRKESYANPAPATNVSYATEQLSQMLPWNESALMPVYVRAARKLPCSYHDTRAFARAGKASSPWRLRPGETEDGARSTCTRCKTHARCRQTQAREKTPGQLTPVEKEKVACVGKNRDLCPGRGPPPSPVTRPHSRGPLSKPRVDAGVPLQLRGETSPQSSSSCAACLPNQFDTT